MRQRAAAAGLCKPLVLPGDASGAASPRVRARRPRARIFGSDWGGGACLGDAVCVANGSLGVGELCSDAASCAPGLRCHWGYEPHQCRPASELGRPCLFDRECVEGPCVLPELEAPYTSGPTGAL